jgi:CheY-like chemotaxis protein
VHIDTLIINTSRLIQRIIGEDIEFSIDFSEKNLMIKADPGQIDQVLMNLATNARDAMPHGGHLTITTRQVIIKEGSEAQFDLPGPGRYALISVADTGTGIDKKSLECIFEPFYTTKEVGMGTGLGLSIIHGIVKQHSGSILVSSELGKGTTFNIFLPLIEGHAVTEKSKIAAPPAIGTETLLVAEDEEIVRNLMKKILENAGYKVIVVNNGEEALTKFEEHDDISLVLTDMVMPKKNGKEMLDEIRKIKPGTKAVFISGYPADIFSKIGTLEEGTEIITKPFKKDKLLQKIREVLDKD